MPNKLSQLISAGVCALAFSACATETTPGGSLGGSPATSGSGARGGSSGSCGTAVAGSSAGRGGAGSGGTAAVAGSGAQTTASATIAPFGTGMLSGTATFTQTGADVTVQISVSNCPDGMLPVHIHQGTACTDATAQGAHWGGDGTPEAPTRGEGIPPITCTNQTGTTSFTRVGTAAANLIWTIGGAAETNVLNHVVVVHNADMAKTRIGCGQIK